MIFRGLAIVTVLLFSQAVQSRVPDGKEKDLLDRAEKSMILAGQERDKAESHMLAAFQDFARACTQFKSESGCSALTFAHPWVKTEANLKMYSDLLPELKALCEEKTFACDGYGKVLDLAGKSKEAFQFEKARCEKGNGGACYSGALAEDVSNAERAKLKKEACRLEARYCKSSLRFVYDLTTDDLKFFEERTQKACDSESTNGTFCAFLSNYQLRKKDSQAAQATARGACARGNGHACFVEAALLRKKEDHKRALAPLKTFCSRLPASEATEDGSGSKVCASINGTGNLSESEWVSVGFAVGEDAYLDY